MRSCKQRPQLQLHTYLCKPHATGLQQHDVLRTETKKKSRWRFTAGKRLAITRNKSSTACLHGSPDVQFQVWHLVPVPVGTGMNLQSLPLQQILKLTSQSCIDLAILHV